MATAVALSFAFAVSINSCKKKEEEDAGKLPNIALTTGTGYTSADATVGKSAAFKIGIQASKAEDNDVLTKFTLTRSYDGGADSTVYTKDLSGGEANSYSYDYSATTRSVAGKEKYTFTVVNKDGLVNKAIVTLTAQ